MESDLTCETCKHLGMFYTVPSRWFCSYAWPTGFRVLLERPACEHHEAKQKEMVQSAVEVVHSAGEIVHK